MSPAAQRFGEVGALLLVDEDARLHIHLSGSEETQRRTRSGADHHGVDVLLGGGLPAGGSPGPSRIGRAGKAVADVYSHAATIASDVLRETMLEEQFREHAEHVVT